MRETWIVVLWYPGFRRGLTGVVWSAPRVSPQTLRPSRGFSLWDWPDFWIDKYISDLVSAWNMWRLRKSMLWVNVWVAPWGRMSSQRDPGGHLPALRRGSELGSERRGPPLSLRWSSARRPPPTRVSPPSSRHGLRPGGTVHAASASRASALICARAAEAWGRKYLKRFKRNCLVDLEQMRWKNDGQYPLAFIKINVF